MTKQRQLKKAKAELEMLKGDIAMFGETGEDRQRIVRLKSVIDELESELT